VKKPVVAGKIYFQFGGQFRVSESSEFPATKDHKNLLLQKKDDCTNITSDSKRSNMFFPAAIYRKNI
jgi:hypothetical protein